MVSSPSCFNLVAFVQGLLVIREFQTVDKYSVATNIDVGAWLRFDGQSDRQKECLETIDRTADERYIPPG